MPVATAREWAVSSCAVVGGLCRASWAARPVLHCRCVGETLSHTPASLPLSRQIHCRGTRLHDPVEVNHDPANRAVFDAMAFAGTQRGNHFAENGPRPKDWTLDSN